MRKTAILAAVLCSLIALLYFALNREPGVAVGDVKLVTGAESEDVLLDAYPIKKFYGDNKTKDFTEPIMMEIAYRLPTVEQAASALIRDDSQTLEESSSSQASQTNTANESESETEALIKTPTDFQIVFTGNYVGDILYTFYDLDGNLIAENQTTLEIPAGSIEDTEKGCIVQIDINWGRIKNYQQTRYFFKCMFT